MSVELVVNEAERKRLLDLLICLGALPGHATKPNQFTEHYIQVLGKKAAIEFFSMIELSVQTKQQETKKCKRTDRRK